MAQTLNGTTTSYVGDDEEVTGGTLLKYYHIPNLPVLGTIVGVTRTYLASDGLGSESVDLSYNGSALATALYGPYGVGRYATGTMPSSKGYTGQRQDSGSGLDYYTARYYDPALGQFASADNAQGPNRYGYVGGNPETANDPTGKRRCDEESDSSSCITDKMELLKQTTVYDTNTVQNPDGSITVITTSYIRSVWSDGTITTVEDSSTSKTICAFSCQRKKQVDALTREAGKDLTISAGLQLLALLTDILSEGTVGALEGLISLGSIANSILNGIAMWVGTSTHLYSIFDHVAAIFSSVAGIASDALSAYKSWGWFVREGLNIAWDGAKVAIEGVPSLIESELGQFVSAGISGGSLYYQAQEDQILSQVGTLQSMSKGDWCAMYGDENCDA